MPALVPEGSGSWPPLCPLAIPTPCHHFFITIKINFLSLKITTPYSRPAGSDFYEAKIDFSFLKKAEN